MNITITNYKSFKGMEGNGFNAILNVDGKKVAEILEEGRGGCMMFHAIGAFNTPAHTTNLKQLKAAQAHAESLPSVEFQGTELSMDLDMLIDNLVNDLQRKKDEKKGILIKTDWGYEIQGWNVSIPTMIKKYGNGKEVIQNAINELDSELILNKEYLKSIGFEIKSVES